MAKLKEQAALMYERYHHLWILSYFILYLAWFSYVEKNITTHFHVIHVSLDDYIPFCEYFVLPYLLWFGYVAWGILYFAFHNKTDYYRLCTCLFTGMTVFLLISTIYPNGHYLRPVSLDRDNLCTALVEMIYRTDTATNLFPSIHVYNSLAIHVAVSESIQFRRKPILRACSLFLCASIILSTVLIKQHSLFDVMTAFLLMSLMHLFVYKMEHRRLQTKIARRQRAKKA